MNIAAQMRAIRGLIKDIERKAELLPGNPKARQLRSNLRQLKQAVADFERYGTNAAVGQSACDELQAGHDALLRRMEQWRC